MNVNNKVIIVTGAGSGIRRALTLALIDKGAKIAAVDIRPTELKDLEKTVASKDSVHLYSRYHRQSCRGKVTSRSYFKARQH